MATINRKKKANEKNNPTQYFFELSDEEKELLLRYRLLSEEQKEKFTQRINILKNSK